MTHFEVPLSPAAVSAGLDTLVETCCREAGLTLRLKGTLAQYPGCIHWHWRREGEPGTLEVTLSPREKRLWLSIHANRAGAWAHAAAAAVQSSLRARLTGAA
jgi:hypothetical protein